jgi:hypothetical protein
VDTLKTEYRKNNRYVRAGWADSHEDLASNGALKRHINSLRLISRRHKMLIPLPRSLSALLFLAVLIIASSANAQPVSITVQDSRPVARALSELESIYHWPITYEDPPCAPDPKSQTLTFTYDSPSAGARPSREDLPAVLRAIRDVLNHYADLRGSDMFTVIQDDTRFHVAPIRFINASGELEKVTPILDTPISISPKKYSVDGPFNGSSDELITEILDAVSLASGQKVRNGAAVANNTLLNHQTLITASNEPARSVLDRLLQEFDNVNLSWQLLY